jgi:hypothetical protein
MIIAYFGQTYTDESMALTSRLFNVLGSILRLLVESIMQIDW